MCIHNEGKKDKTENIDAVMQELARSWIANDNWSLNTALMDPLMEEMQLCHENMCAQ